MLNRRVVVFLTIAFLLALRALRLRNTVTMETAIACERFVTVLRSHRRTNCARMG